MSLALKSESDFTENGREEKAFQAEQRPRGKKVHSKFGGLVSQLAQFNHRGLKRDMTGETRLIEKSQD